MSVALTMLSHGGVYITTNASYASQYLTFIRINYERMAYKGMLC
jgi:hypothetical protein